MPEGAGEFARTMKGLAGSVDATLMAREAAEAPAAVARMLAANRDRFAAIGTALRASPPGAVVTCARGSSDHAATYAKYLIETDTGVPVSSAALSVSSVYDAPVAHARRLCLAISQSGRSPDLIAAVEHQRRAGALVVALVNALDSPLADYADHVVALSAGPERAVAATKSYLCSLAAVAALVAEWVGDDRLRRAVTELPDQLDAAWRLDWRAAIDPLTRATNLFVLGRGYGLGIAQEAALKLKETCGLHAESFSAAEVRHGPMAIVGAGFPILAFAGSDVSGDSVREAAGEFAARGARVLLADPSSSDSVREAAGEFAARGARVLLADPSSAAGLPALPAHPATEPILMIQSFYRLAENLSRARGCDPDAPPHLNKVTETL